MPYRRKSSAIKVVYFDLETSGLQADFGVLLCMAYAVNEGPIQLLSQREHNPHFAGRAFSHDRELAAACAEVLTDADLLVAHNGQYFDLPFLRTRLAIHGLTQLPSRPILDPCQCSRRKLRMSRNDLAGLAGRFNLGKKSEANFRVWQAATLDGSLSAWTAIEAHCRQDVALLRRLSGRFRGLLKQFDLPDR